MATSLSALGTRLDRGHASSPQEPSWVSLFSRYLDLVEIASREHVAANGVFLQGGRATLFTPRVNEAFALGVKSVSPRGSTSFTLGFLREPHMLPSSQSTMEYPSRDAN